MNKREIFFFFRVIVTQGVATPSLLHAVRPRAAGGVWLTILPRLDLLPRLALVVTSARVIRGPEWVFGALPSGARHVYRAPTRGAGGGRLRGSNPEPPC